VHQFALLSSPTAARKSSIFNLQIVNLVNRDAVSGGSEGGTPFTPSCFSPAFLALLLA